ncbi:MAG: NAD-dependent epimerase/dehydratase family protein [Methylococcaceae bacterium]|nr:NAD-dependent epimerase/dehydratase family protein [Methylococcaceae bacterium]
MNILITGVTGFVGSAIAKKISEKNDTQIIATLRRKSSSLPTHIRPVLVGDLLGSTDYSEAVKGIDVVIHTAARVHIMQDNANNRLDEFRKINVDGTLNLAKQAAIAGVRRFIFISSIKVNGEATNGTPFTPDDKITTVDPYGLSKWEAEQGLIQIANETNMDIVIVRPPLIYGPDVKANFLSLMKLMQKGIPLPFGAIHNRRSLVALDNLVNFIIHCIDHPKAANKIFLISDGEDVSTTELLQKVADAFGRKALLLPVPVCWMIFAAKLIGKSDVANRLFGSLLVDSSKTRELLGWKPVITMDEQLKKMVKAE